MKGDLVLLDDVKAWVYKTPAGAGAGANDALLKSMITRFSQLCVTYVNRVPFYKSTVTETRNGYGSHKMILREWPVLSVTSVYVDNQPVSPGSSVPGSGSGWSDGYYLESWDGTVPGNPQGVTLYGSCFPQGEMRTQISYVTGYTVLNELQTIPAANGVVTVTTQPTWVYDEGVTFAATGVALTLVNSETPASGQYALGPAGGQYIFSAADVGLGVKISYDFVPVDLQQALIEWIADRYAYMTRVGVNSQTVGGQMTTSYSVKAVPDFVKMILQQYQRVIMV